MARRPAAAPAESVASGRHPPRVAYLIGRLDRALHRHIAAAVGPFGLTVPEYTALSVLQARGPLSNARLAERSFITPQSMNALVKALEAKGAVLRQPDPSHGRVILFSLSPQGTELLARCDTAVDSLEATMLARLDDGQRAELKSNLRDCVRALSAMSAEL
ncbi:MarR family winged helix-turn-helix transcriptional regulator [Inquilinus sp. CA228]|uniref:MarR family winged helix-turn-helix transcriptional regulator n=1 Tax=Inquilinus sp. CA228 TaxID=3455609 RepID=UPI003F8D499C